MGLAKGLCAVVFGALAIYFGLDGKAIAAVLCGLSCVSFAADAGRGK